LPGDDRHRGGPRAAAGGALLHRLPLLPHRGAARPLLAAARAPGRRAARRGRRVRRGAGAGMTYLALAGAFLAATLPLLAVAVLLRRPGRRWWAATGLTALALV